MRSKILLAWWWKCSKTIRSTFLCISRPKVNSVCPRLGPAENEIGHPSGGPDRAAKSARVEQSSIRGGPSSASPVAKDETFCTDILSDDAQELVNDTATAILEDTLQEYCRKFQCLFQELPDHVEQESWNGVMKIDLILADPPYKVCCELGRKTSDYYSLCGNHISEIVEMCGNYLKLKGHTRMFCSAVQFSSWFKAVSVSTESVTFEDAEYNEQIRKETMFD